MQAYLKAISYYLPEKEVTNAELAQLFPEWGAEKIAKKIGIETRRIAADNEYASDMAVKAAEQLFAEHAIERTAIDFILYCTQSPDQFLPSTACVIQDRLNIPVSAGALDFNLGCSGYVYGLAVAKGLVTAGIASNILLLTAETYSKFIHPEDKGNRTIFGDAASASLISTDGFASIGNFDLGTDGRGAGNLMVKQGGLRFPRAIEEAAEPVEGRFPDEFIYMNGPEIFTFTSREIPGLVDRTLLKNELKKSDIGQFVLHQANQFMLEHLRKKMHIGSKHFFIYMAMVGNTVSSTIPIALYHALKEKDTAAGQHWLLAGFGVGYSWGGTVIKFD
ncbi:ketoacyl-ACP synthase III [Mucilaginibacter pallidiroseus]|uniref:Ketoacyl-ACP synthase III n=1 Tax=Mucilaginibacter pallidiroseus TaxID=2599295 RepID=A0A563U0N4_9SPHI|nr:ketoacyl-ACP synthase III [Mucilaginibacter pallidiroseus]TWR25176.1 ketoacyl-ACP synthase III [Mucilaginibacter pallidiroseus]